MKIGSEQRIASHILLKQIEVQHESRRYLLQNLYLYSFQANTNESLCSTKKLCRLSASALHSCKIWTLKTLSIPPSSTLLTAPPSFTIAQLLNKVAALLTRYEVHCNCISLATTVHKTFILSGVARISKQLPPHASNHQKVIGQFDQRDMRCTLCKAFCS